MAFNPTDYYTVSAGVDVNTLWTPFVTKFDTSSFYNWEQDNLPLYDLEERTELAWSKLGYPTSSVTGMALVVSSTNPDNVKNVFADVASVVEALPNPIRFPIMVEIAASGNLGTLNLENITISEGGALEIVNRVFAKADASATTGQSFNSVLTRQYATIESASFSSTIANTSALSVSCTTEDLWGRDATSLPNPGGNDIRAFFGVSPDYGMQYETDLLSTDFRNTGDSDYFISNTANLFNLQNYEDFGSGQIQDYTTSSMLGFTPEYTLGLLPSGLDVSTFHQTLFVSGLRGDGTVRAPMADIDLYRTTPATGGPSGVGGLAYGNHFSQVNVKNCDGPLYLRGICVDGSIGTGASLVGTYPIANGFDIRNSSVVLENCAATRCNEAGFGIYNSKVILSRGTVAFRNYEVLNNTATSPGIGGPTLARNKGSAGIRAVNSELTLSSHPAWAKGNEFIFWSTRNPIGLHLINSKFRGGDSRVRNLEPPFATTTEPTYAQIFYNSEAGIKAENSVIEVDGRLACYNNEKGMELYSSKLSVDELTVEYSNSTGVDAYNSTIVCNKNSNRTDSASGTLCTTYLDLGRQKRQLEFYKNAQHLRLDNSVFDFKHEKNVFEKCGISHFYGHHGVGTLNRILDKKVTLPGIELINNSRGNFINPRIIVDKQFNLNVENRAGGAGESGFRADNAAKGGAVKVAANSEATFHGSVSGITTIGGPTVYKDQKKSAGVYAGRNSVVNFQGPTRIVGFGVDVLAEDHSTMNFSPHKIDNYDLDISGFNLYNTNNHTSVELHSLRSCLVANKKSTINLKDLGDYHSTWTSAVAGDNFLTPDYQTGENLAVTVNDTAFKNTFQASAQIPINGLYTSSFHHAGSITFLPNPQTLNFHVVDQGQYTSKWDAYFLIDDRPISPATGYNAPDGGGIYTNVSGPANCTSHSLLTNFPWSAHGLDAGTGISSTEWFRNTYSKGGFCVRVVGDSNCNTKNVHFQVPSINASASFYDPSASDIPSDTKGVTLERGEGSHDLRIWNVADTSRLNATYCSFSGNYPGSLPYDPAHKGHNGPSSVYLSGGYQCPTQFSSVHNNELRSNYIFSSLSVLDYFGQQPVQDNNSQAYDMRVIQTTDDTKDGIAFSWFQENRGACSGLPGTSAIQNYGPFRLYYSPNAWCKSLSYFSATTGGSPLTTGAYPVGKEDSLPYQHTAQGYQMSGAVSAIGEFSAIDPSKGIFGGQFTGDEPTQSFGTMSGAFFQVDCYDFPAGGRTGRGGAAGPSHQPVTADESALNTFANAKHNAMSDRFATPNYINGNLVSTDPQFVRIVQPTISPGGDGFCAGEFISLADDAEGTLGGVIGRGFKSSTVFDLEGEN